MSDAVSLTMGNSFLPFRNRLPHHMQLLRQRFLGISFFLSQYYNIPRYLVIDFSKAEQETTASEEDVLSISKRLMEQNKEAYEVLAK